MTSSVLQISKTHHKLSEVCSLNCASPEPEPVLTHLSPLHSLIMDENCHRGAANAAQTRKAKKKALNTCSQSSSAECCGVCKAQYCDETEETIVDCM